MDQQRAKITALQAENAALRQRIAELERHSAEELRQSHALLEGFIEHNPAAISVVDRERRILLVNRAVLDNLQMTREQLVGVRQDELFPPDIVAEWAVSDQQVFDRAQTVTVENRAPLPDGEHTFLSIKFPLFNTEGKVYAIGNIVTDITEQRRAERERAELQEQIIAAQRATLREISTPLIPLADDIMVMPLIGSIDQQRAEQIMEVLLEGITHHQATTVLMDISGVKVVDTQVADALIQIAKAARLLGSHVVLTGISAEVAQTIVHLGAQLSGLVTLSTLQAGLHYAMGQVKRQR